MPSIHLPLAHYNGFALSDRRQIQIDNLDLPNLDCADVRAVTEARSAITQMTPWDRLIDWVFHGNAKQQALQAIAAILLCERACKWQEDNPGAHPVDGLSAQDRRVAQCELVSLLSPEGARKMAWTCKAHETEVMFRLSTEALPSPIDQLVLEFPLPREDMRTPRAEDNNANPIFFALQAGIDCLDDDQCEDRRGAVLGTCIRLLHAAFTDPELTPPEFGKSVTAFQQIKRSTTPAEWEHLRGAVEPDIAGIMMAAMVNGRAAVAESLISLLETMPQDAQARLLTARSKGGNTGLQMAMQDGNEKIIKALVPLLQAMPLEMQVRILGATSRNDVTGPLLAMQNGHTAIVKALIPLLQAMPQDMQSHLLGAADKNGRAGLMMAMQGGYADTIEALVPLLEAMPEKMRIRLLGAASNRGNTGLLLAMQNGHVAVIRTLLPMLEAMPQEAQIRLLGAVADNGNTGLLLAMRDGQLAVIQALVPLLQAMPPDEQIKLLGAVNRQGANGLQSAMQRGHTAIVEAVMSLLKNISRHVEGRPLPDDHPLGAALAVIQIPEAISCHLKVLSSPSGLRTQEVIDSSERGSSENADESSSFLPGEKATSVRTTYNRTIFFEESCDPISYEAFEPESRVEWCLLRRSEKISVSRKGETEYRRVDEIYDFYTKKTVDQLLDSGGTHPFTRAELVETESIIRGPLMLKYLSLPSAPLPEA